MQVLTIPFGSAGSLNIQESAGTVTAAATYTDPNTGIAASINITGSVSGVLAFAAAHVSNATGKVILNDLAAASKLIP